MGTSGDPRKVGGRYYSGYWKTAYTVIDIKGRDITVKWDGDKTAITHSTPWNPKTDRVVSEPKKS